MKKLIATLAIAASLFTVPMAAQADGLNVANGTPVSHTIDSDGTKHYVEHAAVGALVGYGVAKYTHSKLAGIAAGALATGIQEKYLSRSHSFDHGDKRDVLAGAAGAGLAVAFTKKF